MHTQLTYRGRPVDLIHDHAIGDHVGPNRPGIAVVHVRDGRFNMRAIRRDHLMVEVVADDAK